MRGSKPELHSVTHKYRVGEGVISRPAKLGLESYEAHRISLEHSGEAIVWAKLKRGSSILATESALVALGIAAYFVRRTLKKQLRDTYHISCLSTAHAHVDDSLFSLLFDSI